jgi:biopolymer transport protein ExbD
MSGFGRLGAREGPPPMSDINVTPLVDVMLVLLVIFIVAAPLMASSLRLDLPAAPGATPSPASVSLSIALDAEGRVYLGEQALPAEDAPARVAEAARAAAARNPETEVQLRADARVPYGRVAELIGVLQSAGLSRIGFITEVPAR